MSEPKTERSYRTLPMIDAAYEYLLALKERQEEQRMLLGSYYTISSFVSRHPGGKTISPNFIDKTFKRILSKSELPQIRFHDLRHSLVSNRLNSGCSVAEIQDWVGHSSAYTTLTFYSHVDGSAKQHMADSLNQIYSPQISERKMKESETPLKEQPLTTDKK